jgi:TolB-like protein
MKWLFLLTLMLAGCTTADIAYLDARSDLFIKTNYKATDAMVDSVKTGAHNFPANAVVMVGTLVNIDALDESSKLGRTISEQIQARLTQRGYSVIELKLRGQLFIKKDTGELLLSREVQELRKNHQAEAVVVGTYSVAKDYAYVNLKMVDANNLAVGAHDYTLPLDRNVRSMLKNP